MIANLGTASVYETLAELAERRENPRFRDRYLALAADAAMSRGHAAEAELLRQRLLHFNPHHLLKPFASFAEAAVSSDVKHYLEELRNACPTEEAERLLAASRDGGAAVVNQGAKEARVEPAKNGLDGPKSSARKQPAAAPVLLSKLRELSKPRPVAAKPIAPAAAVYRYPPRELTRSKPAADPLGIAWLLLVVVLGAAGACLVYTLAGPWWPR